MAEKRKAKKRREEQREEQISADEHAVAKYLRENLPTKETMMYTHKVKYFVASKAVDCLLDSKWAMKTKTCGTPLFSNRESVVDYLDIMLYHKFFHRAKKIQVSTGTRESQYVKEPRSGDDKESKKKKKAEEREKRNEEEKKKKKKCKLEMHLEQMFLDGHEIYVWIYDPIPMSAWFTGGIVVTGVILLCLFPLWPPIVRKGVYYISIAAAGLLVFILGLAVLRVVVFSVLWAGTLGNHHLWLLPNLTEDVGFLDSFWPLYKYEYHGRQKKYTLEDYCAEKDDQSKKKKKKESRQAGASLKESDVPMLQATDSES